MHVRMRVRDAREENCERGKLECVAAVVHVAILARERVDAA
jgi:hypothetical protein